VTVALLDQGEAGITAVLGEDLGDGPAAAVLALNLQRDFGADGKETLERLPGLLPVGDLHRLRGVDAGSPDRDLPSADIDAEHVAITD
jgi:hypothetical protein